MFARKVAAIAVAGAAALVIGSSTYAATETFYTPPGAFTSGGPVSASATFSTTGGALTVTVTDLLPNPTDVAQLVSDLDFKLSVDGTATLTSSNANFINIAADGSVSSAGSGSTGWVLGPYNGGLVLCVICPTGSGLSASVAPAHLIIGLGPYTNANGSIAGNGPHNPFIDQTATFSIADSLINADTTVSNVVFSFGTTPGLNVAAVPEPGTLALLGSGLLAMGGIGRKRKVA